jgi:hypothetical protein
MTSSTCLSQSSTYPLLAIGLIILVNGTYSPSEENIACIVFSSSNSNAAIPSKHFFK